MSDYFKGYTDALAGTGWLASVDPAALLEFDLVGFEPLSIREHRRKYDAAVKAEALAGLTHESCGTNRLGQPTRRLVGPVEVEP